MARLPVGVALIACPFRDSVPGDVLDGHGLESEWMGKAAGTGRADACRPLTAAAVQARQCVPEVRVVDPCTMGRRATRAGVGR